MKKAFDQTVRDLKREVNKKVLKVPSIEQKVLDATSNEPWGPHGSHLADIAQATRNYHDYQMIMAVVWKRINDTGKNWRHVFKALIVLEYLIAHGSERVIDEIREHAYQISTLADFQYIDSNGRDQGSNVRKKSQSLVVLGNDKERIHEAREKAAANRDKYRNTSAGNMYRPSSYSGSGGYGDRYDDDRYEGRYGTRDGDRNGSGRERDGGDHRYGRYGNSYGRDGNRYGSNSEDRYSQDGYRDDDYRGRSRSIDDYNYGSRSRSADRERDRTYEDDGQYSSRGSAKADDHSQEGSIAGRRLVRKISEQNIGAPPSYEDAGAEGRSPAYSDRDGETSAACPPKPSSPPVSNHQATTAPAAPTVAPPPTAAPTTVSSQSPPPPPPPAASNEETDGFDEFDPRGSFPAPPVKSNNMEMDLLGSLSESFASNSLAIVPTTAATSEADTFGNSSSGQTFVAPSTASDISTQPFGDPFGDGPFKAIPSTEAVPAAPHISVTSAEPPQPVANKPEVVSKFGISDTFTPSNILLSTTAPQYSQDTSVPNQEIDILAGMLSPSAPSPPIPSLTSFQAQTIQPETQPGFLAQSVQNQTQQGFLGQPAIQTSQTLFYSGFPVQTTQPSQVTGFSAQTGPLGFLAQSSQAFPSHVGSVSQPGFPVVNAQSVPPGSNFYGGFQQQPPLSAAPVNNTNVSQQLGSAAPPSVSSQVGPTAPMSLQQSLPSTAGALALVPAQPAKEKFETKSTVWADTLNRGLVNLNISGPKTNPLADLGIDFEAINRKEKRMEKPSVNAVSSNVSMGKAMGVGSGIGRAGAGALRAPPNPSVGSGRGSGYGGGPGPAVVGPTIGGYGVSQPVNMGGIGVNLPVNVGQGLPMNPQVGFPGGTPIRGVYPGYSQQPYGGAYR